LPHALSSNLEIESNCQIRALLLLPHLKRV
jgi:hypothetical protein